MPPRNPNAGRTPLPVNLWLQAQLEAGRTPRQLRAEWLQRHREERGWPLIEPHRSFRAAVQRAVRRLERKGR